MKKRLHVLLMIAVLVSVFFATPALASPGDSPGGCPPGFELHAFMDHSGEHMHQHIGVNRDLNGDGYICMKMLPNDLHLHIDNSIP